MLYVKQFVVLLLCFTILGVAKNPIEKIGSRERSRTVNQPVQAGQLYIDNCPLSGRASTISISEIKKLKNVSSLSLRFINVPKVKSKVVSFNLSYMNRKMELVEVVRKNNKLNTLKTLKTLRVGDWFRIADIYVKINGTKAPTSSVFFKVID